MTSLLSSIILRESITHLEDLPLPEFIKTVETLKDKIITEKLDGANLWFGIDDNGLFTSREGKSPKKGRFYDVADYPMVANYNGFRAVHLALEKAEPVIKKYLQEGDMVEIEVLFGRQPNTVTYGVNDKNFIVILRGVNDTPQERVDALAKAVNNKSVTIESTIVSSPDGEQIVLKDEKLKWEFTQVKQVNTDSIDTNELQEILKGLKEYMAAQNEVLGMSNEEVSELSLNQIPKEKRPEAKSEREKVLATLLNTYKNPIKELLLGKFVRKIKPFLQDKNLHPSEDIGVEGVVVRDPETGEQTKIVDKDVFTAINTFNSSVRSSVAGLTRTTDQDATIEMRGGSFGQAKIRIADLLGAKELALSSGVKRFVTKFKGDSPEATAAAIARSLNITSLNSVRTKISAILKNSLDEVNGILDGFKKESGEYKLKLKTGKEIGITPEVMKRTLTAFAETKKDILEINAKVRTANDAAELVLALYGRTIESIFDGANEVKESYKFLKSIVEDDAAPAGGGEAQMANPAAYTAAGAVASPEKKLFGSKPLIRRKRNQTYTAIKKFPAPKNESKMSLLKSINEDWAHVKDMKFATDVDDTAGAKNDVEFNQLRNNVNVGDNVTQMDVNRYLDKAHELNDEVDSIVFGMETDDGKIVKVYVNAAQADDFEKALAELLGQQDDLEQVINDLANKFDIVDVEWPEGFVSTSGENIGNEETPQDSDEPDYDDEGEPEIHMGIDGEDETPPEDSAETAEEEPDELDTDIDSSDEEEPKDDETPKDDSEESTGDESDELDTDVDSDEENPEDDTEEDEVNPEDTGIGPLVKRKKSKKPTEDKAEESMQTLGQKFKDKLLAEAKKVKDEDEVKKDDKDAEDTEVKIAREKSTEALDHLLTAFSTKQSKAIIVLLVTLGVPVKTMKMRKAELRTSIDAAADRYIKDSSFRMWCKKLLSAINSVSTVKESNFDGKLANKYQHITYAVLKELGMPESIETQGQRALIAGIRATAKLAIENSSVRIYLLALADNLGIDVNKLKAIPDEDAAVNEAVDDPFELVSPLLTALGFDVNKSQSLATQASHGAKMKLASVTRNPAIKSKIGILTQLVQDKAVNGGTVELSNVQKSGKVISEDEGPADQGAWNIAKLGSNGIMLKIDGLNLKIKEDEVGKLKIILEKRKYGSVVAADGKRYEVAPLKGGAFSIKKMNDETDFPHGIILPKDQVVELMDMISETD